MHNLPVYRATVIGAGPAGLACVGNLLDNLPVNEKILWIDPQFRAGRLSSYPAVPSNTKVCLFTKFAEECKSFDSNNLKSLKFLKEKLDGQKGCQLKFASELCQEITGKLLKVENLKSIKSTAISLKYSEDLWNIETSENSSFKSKMIFLTTGSKPKSLNLPENEDFIELDEALNPEILNEKIKIYDKISVYGSSHSAMLVLKNLLQDDGENNKSSSKLITNYYRQSAKFASFPDPINYPDKIIHDNTGLKGEVADWVKTWIELDENELKSKFNLSRINTANVKIIENNVNNVNIFAVGYERNLLPKIIYEAEEMDVQDIDYTTTGQLTNKKIALSGIFGFGIAFPERVKDLDGSDEAAVGMWKFMKHIKKSIQQLILH